MPVFSNACHNFGLVCSTTQRLGDDVAEIRKKQKDTDRMLRVQERRLQESQLNFPSLNGTLGNAFAEASGNDKHRPDKSTSSGTLSYAISCLIVGIATAVMPFLYLYRVTLSMMPQLNSSLFFPTHGFIIGENSCPNKAPITFLLPAVR